MAPEEGFCSFYRYGLPELRRCYERSCQLDGILVASVSVYVLLSDSETMDDKVKLKNSTLAANKRKIQWVQCLINVWYDPELLYKLMCNFAFS